MGFSYLEKKRWAEVTREERFFCQHLFGLLVRDEQMKILTLVKDHDGNAPPCADKWEPAFEVCFYRDFSFHFLEKRKKNPFSRKRTFDLCLFSEKAIIVIEAKAQQGFQSKQLTQFETDRCQIKKLVSGGSCTSTQKIWIIGIASSQYNPRPTTTEYFDGPLLTWADLSKLYGNDVVLQRADEVYRR